jgi:hypothetical protein
MDSQEEGDALSKAKPFATTTNLGDPDKLSVGVATFVLVPYVSLDDLLSLACASRTWRFCLRAEAVWQLIYKRDLAPRTFASEHVATLLTVLSEQVVRGACDVEEAKKHLLNNVLPFLPMAFGLRGVYRIFDELPHCSLASPFIDCGFDTAFARDYKQEISALPDLPLINDRSSSISEPESVTFGRLSSWPFGLPRLWPPSQGSPARSPYTPAAWDRDSDEARDVKDGVELKKGACRVATTLSCWLLFLGCCVCRVFDAVLNVRYR